MAEKVEVKELEDVVVRFSGDSGDGMQLAGNIFSTVSATVGNGISTFARSPVCRAIRSTLARARSIPQVTNATCSWP